MKLPNWVYELSERVLVESIKFPTVLGESYHDIVKYYSDVLKEYGVHVTIHEVPRDYVVKHLPKSMNPDKPRYILLARIGSGERVLQFNGHYDVVAPGEGWSITDPFKPKRVDYRVYGRGSVDMKGGIAAIISTIAYLSSTKEPKDHVIEAAIVPDEEIGGETGTGYLVRELKSRPDWAIIAEPSGLETIWIGHKGAVWAEVYVKGRQAHGSTPWKGDNAFEKMVYLAKYIIENIKPRIESRKSNYEYDEPESKKATMVLGGKLVAPGSINIVPGLVGFSIDRRLIVEENVEGAEKELLEYLDEASKTIKVDIDVKIVARLQPAFTRPDSQLVKKVDVAAKEVIGKEPRKVVCTGGLDLHYYTEAGVNAISYGPGDPSLAHKVDEYIDLRSIYRIIEIYSLIARNAFT